MRTDARREWPRDWQPLLEHANGPRRLATLLGVSYMTVIRVTLRNGKASRGFQAIVERHCKANNLAIPAFAE